MFRDVLVATDGSADAQRALEEAIDLVRLSGGSLTLAMVVPDVSGWFPVRSGGTPPPVNPAAGVPLPDDFGQVREELSRQYRERLEQVHRTVPDDVESTALLLKGRPADAIVRQVRAGGYDLVVMGSRGRGEVRALVLGSTSHGVLNDSPVPVLIIRLRESEPRH